MRTIKFRGKQAFCGAGWKYGNLCGTTNNATIEEIIQDKENEKIYWTPRTQVIPETIGQFTGLLDKNGKEIYEGDIVEFVNVDLHDCVIVYDNGSFMYRELGEDISLEELRLQFTVEIIGNIHDNPELIKQLEL